jgi:hypothetical protein
MDCISEKSRVWAANTLLDTTHKSQTPKLPLFTPSAHSGADGKGQEQERVPPFGNLTRHRSRRVWLPSRHCLSSEHMAAGRPRAYIPSHSSPVPPACDKATVCPRSPSSLPERTSGHERGFGERRSKRASTRHCAVSSLVDQF